MKALVIRNIEIEGLGLLADLITQSGWAVDMRAMDAGDAPPPDLTGHEALVVLGGPMNVYEEDAYPYLRQVDALLREAFAGDVPVLGICLGAQLMAKALGAPVTRNPVKEIGWSAITLTDAGQTDALFAGLGPSLSVFQWHGDTFDIPAGAIHTARSPDCPAQAFRCGRASYAFQFHLEVTPEMIDRWLAAYGEELAALGALPGEILADTAARAPECARLAETVFGRWIDHAGRSG